MFALFHHAMAVLAVAWAYFCAHLAAPIGTVLVPMLISTLIAGRVNKGVASDGKLVQLLKLFVRFCGWAVHYNEPGSVKLPAGELLMLIWKGIVLVYRVFKPASAALLLVVALGASGCSWEPIDPMTGLTIALIAGGGGLALLVARALALRSAALVLALLLAFMALPGCATPFGKAYSGCVKSSTSAAFSANAQNIPAQAEAILSAALSANWVAAGLDLLLDLVKDTGAEAVVVCVVTAWQAAHPLPADASPAPALATAHAGANQFLAAHPAAVKASSCVRVRF